MPRNLTTNDLDEIEDGATILGCGGGGPRWAGELLRDYLQNQVKAGKAIRLVRPVDDDVHDEAVVAVVAVVGSMAARQDLATKSASTAYTPHPQVEPFVELMVKAVDELEKTISPKKITHVMPLEIGAGNALVPMVVAQAKGIAVVDASGAERAVPVLDATTFSNPSVKGFLSNTSILVDPNGGVHPINALSASAAADNLEEILSSSAVYPDGSLPFGFFAGLLLDGATTRATVIPGTLTRAQHLGRILALTRNQGQREALAVIKALGKDDVIFGLATRGLGDRTPTIGVAQRLLDTGEYTIVDAGGADSHRVVYANENLAVRDAATGKVIATSPELICVLRRDQKSGDWLPFTNDSLQDGDNLVLIMAHADEKSRSKAVTRPLDRVIDALLAAQ